MNAAVKSISDRVKEAETEVVRLMDELQGSTAKLEADPTDENLIAVVAELTGAVTKAEKSLETLKGAEKVLATRATQKEVDAPAIVNPLFMDRNAPKNPGDVIFKHATAQFIAFVQGKQVEQIIEERYSKLPYVKATFDYLHKTAVPPARTDVAGWAQELTRSDTRGYLETLKDVSVAAALASVATSLDFGGFNSIKIPRRAPFTATPTEPAWVGETGVIPLTRFAFTATELFRYKLAAITTFSEELAERSSPQIEGVLREALRDAYAEVLDAALLGNAAAVPGVRPAGLLNGIASLTPTAGGGEDAVRGDVQKLVASLVSNHLGARPVLLINNLDRLSASMMTSALSEYLFRADLAANNLLGLPIISSANVPLHTAIIVDAAYLATAFDTPLFDVSRVATVVEANADATAPTHATGAAGAIGTAGQVPIDGGIRVSQQAALGAAAAGYTARSLWQTYSVGIRMIAPTSWATMQPGTVAYIAPTTWTP